jgi:hypothetical protein
LGTRSAHEVLVQIRAERHDESPITDVLELSPAGSFVSIAPSDNGWHTFESARPIHPGLHPPLFTAQTMTGSRMVTSSSGQRRLPVIGLLRVHIQVYSVDQDPQECVVEFDGGDIAQVSHITKLLWQLGQWPGP